MGEPGQTGARVALFRLEFGGAHGWGHLVRSGALAAALRARGWRCVLWTASGRGSVPEELIEPFADLVPFTGASVGVPLPCDWLVVDHYGASDEQLRRWRAGLRGRMLAIDDEMQRRLDAADLVLNTRLGLRESRYAAGVATLLGEHYALLRAGLRDPAAPAWTAPPGATPVLVMLGGTDPTGATGAVLAALDPAGIVPIVVGGRRERPEALTRFASSVWLTGVNARELAGWAGLCRFAVSAAGGTLYELAALGLPFVAVVVAENQRAFAAAAAARWKLPCVADGPGLRDELAAAVRALISDLENARAALTGIDGRGAERVAEAMIQPE